MATFRRMSARLRNAMVLAAFCFHSHAQLAAADQKTELINKGKLLYIQHCVICHQAAGQGSAGTFPPLARSDLLMAKPETAIRAVVEGLSGPITVNGTNYNNTMPPFLLTDEQVAAVLTFVRNSWGNQSEPVNVAEVSDVRGKSRFPTYEALKRAAAYPPLPKAPEGFSIRKVLEFTENPVRMVVAPGNRDLCVLTDRGNVWRIEPRTSRVKQIIRGDDYLRELRRIGDVGTLGIAFDSKKRFYVTGNTHVRSRPFATNQVVIFRNTTVSNGEPAQLKPLMRVSYPWGIGPFNHGVSHIAQGPDGFIYVSSGSRTDGNEPGNSEQYYKGGEVEVTACLWRFDPENPGGPEIYARGLRNGYGFCWTDAGDLFATENGPDADAPEELNAIRQGRHYGFPFQFADWTNKPYAHTPDSPDGVSFTYPVANLGPAGGVTDKPLYTFDPHSSPAGIIYVGRNGPEPLRDSFLVARFGNLLKKPKDIGFDVLQMRVRKKPDGSYESKTTTWLAPLARPIDLAVLDGKIYVAEYTRPLDNKGEVPMLPGRLLEISKK